MTRAKSFDDVRTSRNGRSKGCPRCGAERNAASISVLLRQLTASGTMNGATMIATKTRSFCEPCSVAIYEGMEALLVTDAEVKV